MQEVLEILFLWAMLRQWSCDNGRHPGLWKKIWFYFTPQQHQLMRPQRVPQTLVETFDDLPSVLCRAFWHSYSKNMDMEKTTHVENHSYTLGCHHQDYYIFSRGSLYRGLIVSGARTAWAVRRSTGSGPSALYTQRGVGVWVPPALGGVFHRHGARGVKPLCNITSKVPATCSRN